MKTPLDHMIKEVLTEAAEASPPSGLAKAAVRRATRRRTAERSGMVALAVLAVVLVGIPVAVRAADGGTAFGQRVGAGIPPTAPPPPAVQPALEATPAPAGARVVTAYSGVGNPYRSDGNTSLLLDPRTGRHEELPYLAVSPSPDGMRAVVYTDDGPDRSFRTGVLDRRTGQVRWIPGDGAYQRSSEWAAEWSPGGERILLSYRPDDRPGGFLIVDAETLDVTTVDRGEASRDMTSHNAVGAGFVWVPNGKEVALTLSRSSGDETSPDIVEAVRFYNLDGRATRTLPVKAAGQLTSSAEFTADGRRMALADLERARRDRPEVWVVDTGSGEVTHLLTGPAGGRLIGWYDDQRLMFAVYTDSGSGVDHQLLLMDLSGHIVKTVPLEPRSAERIHVGSGENLTGAAAKLAF